MTSFQYWDERTDGRTDGAINFAKKKLLITFVPNKNSKLYDTKKEITIRV